MVLTEEERKVRQRIACKKYRESEKGKEKYQISTKKYQNSEKGKKRYKKYQKSEKYKEYTKEYQKKYQKSEKYKEYKKEYLKSEKGKKKTIKARWKHSGLNMDNFEEIYERYEMAIFCDICECVLNVEGNYNSTKCMDHCHITGEFRNIVCNYCNLHICK